MRVERVTGRVIEGPLEPVYVYEAPVRIWHWVVVLSMIALAVTGYLIGSPLPAIGGEPYDTYLFAYIRMIHFIAAWVFVVAFAVRIYWAFVGNHHARSIFLPPVWSFAWWRGLFSQGRYYLFLKRESDLWVGHNPLAQLAMFAMFTLGAIFMIVTGLALYSEQWGWGLLPMNLTGWVFALFGGPQMVRTLHHLCMWYLLLFAFIHIYMVFREDVMSGESVIGTMINGIRMWKREPGGEGGSPR
ncbi:MAG TPA: Ni/Fe-hydrogenase, b-type cytochrome subunit [Casimicrobiaceae bacterium]|nr:Ni/Fe-hydrogenase, b-type cytochrome subunit [Casimicrobiaceae bacterium]